MSTSLPPKVITFLAVAFLIVGLSAASPANAAPWVSAYYAGWYWDWTGSNPAVAVDAVDMTAMTHFIFGRYAPGGGTLGGSPGQVLEGAGTGHSQVESALIAKAHANAVKALFMLGGVGDGGGFVSSTANSSIRATFIANLLDICVARDYDGIDVDWEDSLDNTTQRNQLIAFLTELRSAAASRARYQAPNDPFIITFPGFSLNLNYETVPAWKVTVASLVDQYNLMSYGQNFNGGGWESWFFGALKGHGPTHPSSIAGSIQAYVDAGVPRSKMGMGIGLYGNYYYPPVTGPRQTISGMGGGDDNYDTWENFYEKGLFDHPNGTYVWDAQAETGYYTYSPAASYKKASWASTESIGMLTTEDLQSIAAKGAWTRAGNCGGTIVWTINYGYVGSLSANPPMEAVKEAFLAPGGPVVEHALTVSRAGTGAGTVTSSPTGIDCGATCTATYSDGTVVTLSASAAGGSTFSGWSGACSGTGACQVTMNAARSVTATFDLQPPSLSIDDVTLDEGDAGSQNALFTVTLSAASSQTVTVDYATADGTASAGSDYVSASGTLSFSPGALQRTIAVAVTGDTAVEPDETFLVDLSNPSGATLGRTPGQATILNDDVAVPAARPYDFNGDGMPDLLWQHDTSRALKIWLMDGTTRIGESDLSAPSFPGVEWQVAGVADFDADGQNDILWHEAATDRLLVWFMNGAAKTAEAPLNPSTGGTGWWVAGVADLSGDEKPDILWRHESGSTYVWLMDGIDLASGSYLSPHFVPPGWHVRAVGDFDYDTRPDILWQHDDGSLYVWYMDGHTLQSGSYLDPAWMTDPEWRVARVTDCDDDGYADVVWHHLGTGSLYLWSMVGASRVSESALTPGEMSDTHWKLVPGFLEVGAGTPAGALLRRPSTSQVAPRE